jgi:hypothetical protein
MQSFIHFTLVINKKGKETRYDEVAGVHIERIGNNIFVKFDQPRKGIITILLDRTDTIKIEYETYK